MTNHLTSRQLGKAGFGAVCLGKLENGKDVAVKILDASSQQGIPEFLNEAFPKVLYKSISDGNIWVEGVIDYVVQVLCWLDDCTS